MAAATTVIAGIGLAVTAGTTVASFVQASKQRKLMEQANADADKAMAEAREKLNVNFYDQLAVQKEPYELEREALLSAGAQAIQAGVESGRGAAATAGRVQMAQNESQAGIRTAMGEELSNLAKLSAAEESRLRDIGVQLDLEEVALGAQQKALGGMEFSPEEFAKFESLGKTPRTDGFSSLDFQQIGGMDKSQYKNFLKTLSPKQQQMLFTNPQYLQSMSEYNPFAI